MHALIATLAVIALIALGVWLLGSIVLRIAGVLIVLAGLVAAVQGQSGGLLVVAIGAVAWAPGHWLYAYRHHAYRSPLARRLFLSRPRRGLDPARGWVVPTTPRPRPAVGYYSPEDEPHADRLAVAPVACRGAAAAGDRLDRSSGSRNAWRSSSRRAATLSLIWRTSQYPVQSTSW
jgi:hypothetical protein